MKVCWGGFTQLRHLLCELLMIFRNKRGELAKDDLLGWQCIVFYCMYMCVCVIYYIYVYIYVCMYIRKSIQWVLVSLE